MKPFYLSFIVLNRGASDLALDANSSIEVTLPIANKAEALSQLKKALASAKAAVRSVASIWDVMSVSFHQAIT